MKIVKHSVCLVKICIQRYILSFFSDIYANNFTKSGKEYFYKNVSKNCYLAYFKTIKYYAITITITESYLSTENIHHYSVKYNVFMNIFFIKFETIL